MIRIVCLLKRKEGTTPEQFRKHYEEIHVPLLRRLGPLFMEYSREYLQHDIDYVPSHMQGVNLQFDVVTQFAYETQADFDKHQEMLKDPALVAELRADEEKFIDRDASAFVVVEREVTPDEVLDKERKAFAAATA